MICLASSLKRGGLCVAGRELTGAGLGSWTRPVSARPGAELTYLEYRYETGLGPKLLDVVDVPVLKADRRGHQVENFLIDHSRRWMARGRLPFARVAGLVEEPASLWTKLGEHVERMLQLREFGRGGAVGLVALPDQGW